MEKEKAKLLMKQIEEIEAEILQNQDILKANNIGMDEPLTDDQDFPRTDIDHYAVRAARGKIRCLQTDYKTKMAEMETVLLEIHKSTAENEVEKGAKENEPQVHRTSNDPFVQVEKVVPDSPAKEAGLCDGDLIVQFGPLYADIFQRLDQLKEVVMGSVNKPIRMTVLRNVRVQHLQLTPRNWSGSGLVGCSFTVVEKNKKHK